MTTPLRLLIIGAHPDDADYSAGGLASLYRRHGHVVKMVSVTDGRSGHHEISGPALVARRRAEAAAAGKIIGAEYVTLDAPDGGLMPTIENRNVLIRLIRSFRPDLVLTHRPNDYHPDHRVTSQLVQDASYLLTVPPIAPDTPHLRRMPVIAYMPDDFQKPYPLTPTVAIDVGPMLDDIIAMLDCHVSQFYEWLPYNQEKLDQVPADAAGRKEFLRTFVEPMLRRRADRHRVLLKQIYGEEGGSRIEFAEAYEPCEYGSSLDDSAKRRLFPFLG